MSIEGTGKESLIYHQRFSSSEDATRSATWEVLCEQFFQKRISADSVVVDLGAGDGNFIRNIRCARPIAVDLSEHARILENQGIETYIVPATEFSHRLDSPVDTVFMSNFLEHLPSKKLVLDVLAECHNALRPGGQVLILQPNIRYTGPAYWDYIDHHIALTEHSLTEALEISGFKIVEMIPRFLPYTAKSTVGHLASGQRTRMMVSLYLKNPWLWKLLGQQTFVSARKL
jgi:SAM-dependent methyltransferase